MIPTRYKAKLPRHLSYPIGAEALTEGLTGAPHAELLTASFWGKPVGPDSIFQRALGAKQPLTVLVTKYRPPHKPGYSGARYMIESVWYDEQWQLTIYPVLRELRHLANRLLRERGLPMVVQWLRSSGHAGWMSRDQQIELVFNPTDEALSAIEDSGV